MAANEPLNILRPHWDSFVSLVNGKPRKNTRGVALKLNPLAAIFRSRHPTPTGGPVVTIGPPYWLVCPPADNSTLAPFR